MVLSVFGLTLASALERCGGLPRDLEVVELWSGVGAVARAARKVGAAAQEFDINRVPGATDTDDPELTENILLEAGFLRALSLAMRLRKGGLLWMAPVCASWVFLCISRTKRHKAARYEGNVGCASVRDGNQMACMAALLYSVAFARGVDVVLENPSSSTIFMYGPLVDVLAAIGPDKKSTAVCPHCAHSNAQMGSRYGKKFKFLGTADWIVQLARKCKCPGRQHVKLVTESFRDGVRKVTGRSAFLKDSAAYPAQLGRAIIAAWQSHEVHGPRSEVRGPKPLVQAGAERWWASGLANSDSPRARPRPKGETLPNKKQKVAGGNRWWAEVGASSRVAGAPGQMHQTADPTPVSFSSASSSRSWTSLSLCDVGHSAGGLVVAPKVTAPWSQLPLDSEA